MLPHLIWLNKYWGLEAVLLCILTARVEKLVEIVASSL